MNTYGLPATYTSRLKPEYFDDVLPNSTDWQADVYRLAAQMARQVQVKRLVDIGCGRSGKLALYAGEFAITGIDFGDNIDACEKSGVPGTWIRADLSRDIITPETLRGAVVICADVIEHIPDLEALIGTLRNAAEVAEFVLVSTPDRQRMAGAAQDGPPRNPHHVREWANAEFSAWLESEKLPIAWSGWTASNDAYPDQLWTNLVVLSKGRQNLTLPLMFEKAHVVAKNPAKIVKPVSSHALRIWMTPTVSEASRDTTNAIHRVVLSLDEHLRAFDMELVEHPDNADLRVAHAGQGSDQSCDVAMYHGLYPTAQGMDGPYFAVNSHVIHNLKTAKAITAPSNWIADVLRRDMHVNPHVIGWGVDSDEWQPGDSRGYVLWNKARQDQVSDPVWMQKLAAKAPTVPFVSTFGDEGGNVKIIGRQPYERMKEIVRGARVYLSTNVETFGIGILEAMAAGVPILGFRQASLADIVQHGVHGFLAEPGDMDGLLEGLHYCIQHRHVLGSNARVRSQEYSWERVAAQFADVFRSVLEPHQGAKCSVIIPCHNYAHYVMEAVESVRAQTATFDFEIIVVNDSSTDESADILRRELTRPNEHYCEVDFKSLSATRNWGIQKATGDYVACLDADDRIGSPHFLQVLADALDADRTLGIAFTSIRVMDAGGHLRPDINPWPKGYDFDQQVLRRNQIPSLCLFRKEAWRRAGGFKTAFRYAEDAEFWTEVGGLGYGAKHVVADGWFHYRLHSQSASQVHRTGEIREPDWTEFYPWTKDGQRPFAADGKAPQGSWPVRFYHQPDVTVIIPVGPGHEEHVKNALHSVEGQTHRFWECIVVNDSGQPLNLDDGFPWARVVETPGQIGAGAARNLGAKQANAPFLVFLDADDLLLPRFLELTLKAYKQHGKYVYTDWCTQDAKTMQRTVHETPDYSFDAIWQKPSLHPVTALIPRGWFQTVGGFDENLPANEDVDFFMNMLMHGFCGVRVPEPLLIYNLQYGQRRASGEKTQNQFKALLKERYGSWMEGNQMCNCVEPPKGLPPAPPSPENLADYQATYGDMVKIVLSGEEVPLGQAEFLGPATRVNYRRRARGDVFYVWQADFEAAPYLFSRVQDYASEAVPTVVPPEPTPIDLSKPGIVSQMEADAELVSTLKEAFSPEPVAEEVTAPEPEPETQTVDLDSMSKAELKRYAADLNIDLTGAKTNQDIVNRIRKSSAA